ncbi:putative lipase [Mycena sanguinolenta]|uniref:Putative lipase n=1 Tax=Mycena sanguinolenta TaxID=230812 RepID=A0A8H6Z468_9AGAR|nr:putative lipase [Mycena sanguinolenta]
MTAVRHALRLVGLTWTLNIEGRRRKTTGTGMAGTRLQGHDLPLPSYTRRHTTCIGLGQSAPLGESFGPLLSHGTWVIRGRVSSRTGTVRTDVSLLTERGHKLFFALYFHLSIQWIHIYLSWSMACGETLVILQSSTVSSKETIPDPSFHVLVAETNKEDSTYDGIDWGGERVAEEIVAEVDKLRQDGRTVTRFSIAGYSLGGLLSRYVCGILRQRGFFENVTPVNFTTFATPHIGLPRYPSWFSSLASVIGPKLLSRTGEQFYCADQWSAKGRPLLEVMADPDRIFYQALAAFQTIRIYANSINDRTVPYVTAAIEVDDPFAIQETNGLEMYAPPYFAHYSLKSRQRDGRTIHSPHQIVFGASSSPASDTETNCTLARLVQKLQAHQTHASSLPAIPLPAKCRTPCTSCSRSSSPSSFHSPSSASPSRHALRARIRLLENDASSTQKLAHILMQLEKQVEHAVVDLIDDDAHAGDPPADPETAFLEQSPSLEGRSRSSGKPQQALPILTETQRRIAAWLNRLPLKKERAYFPNVMNSHALIICRDVKNFQSHRQGESVVRSWADSFVL